MKEQKTEQSSDLEISRGHGNAEEINLDEIGKKTAVATRWSAITEVAAKLITPIINMILARLLTPEMFGIVATVNMVVSFADIFTDAGFQKYLMQHDFESEESLNRNTDVAFWTNLTISAMLWLAISAFAKPLAVLLGNPGTENAIIVAALALPLTSFSSIQMARFKRTFDFKSLFYIRLVTACIPLVVTVPLALITRSFWALIIGTLVSQLANAVILTIRSSWKPKWFYDFRLLRGMFSYSWWILLESISNWITSYIGTFIVGLFLSTYYVGLYKTSMSTVNQIISLITLATSAPLFVALSRLKNNHIQMIDTYCKFIQAIGVMVIPLGVGLFLYRDLITSILLGKQWTEASNFVGLWGMTSSFCLILGTYCNGLYNAKGKTWLSFLAQILHLVVLVPVLFWAAPKGFETLYIARSIVRFELVLVQIIIMKVCMKVPMLRQLKDMLPSLVCTGIMMAVAVVLKQVSSAFGWDVFSVAVCILVYFVAYFVFFRKLLFSALSVLGVRIRRKEKNPECG